MNSTGANGTHKQEIIEQTEELLEAYKHPDPYRPPTAPGGSKYQRNLPAPILDRTSIPSSELAIERSLTYSSLSTANDSQGDASVDMGPV